MICMSWVMILLIDEVEEIITEVYEIGLGKEIMVFVKIMLTLANVEAGGSVGRRKNVGIDLI